MTCRLHLVSHATVNVHYLVLILTDAAEDDAGPSRRPLRLVSAPCAPMAVVLEDESIDAPHDTTAPLVPVFDDEYEDMSSSSESDNDAASSRSHFPLEQVLGWTGKLLAQQLLRPSGCSTAKHDERQQEHLQANRAAGVKCGRIETEQWAFSPREIMRPGDLPGSTVIIPAKVPDILGRDDMHSQKSVTQYSKQRGLTSTKDKPADFSYMTKAMGKDGGKRLAYLYEAREPKADKVHNVCLECEFITNKAPRPALDPYLAARGPETTMDIDSFTGFAKTLAVAKNGFNWQIKASTGRNISSHVHGVYLRHNGYDSDGNFAELVLPLNKVVHTHLGYILGVLTLSMWIFFPGIQRSADQTTYLTNVQLAMWYDQVVWPALECTDKSAANRAEVARNYNVVTTSSNAYEEERRVRADHTADAAQGLPVQAHILGPMWDKMLEIIQDNPALDIFQGCKLYISAKDRKRFARKTSWTALNETWQDQLHNDLNVEHLVERAAWVDIAMQINPQRLLPRDAAQDMAPHHGLDTVLGWRQCCLDTYYQMRNQKDNALNKEVYYQAGLRDIGSMTIEPKPTSIDAMSGLVYSQLYVKTKDPLIAFTVQPWANEALETLCFDPIQHIEMQKAGGGVSADRSVQVENYIKTKRRVREAITSQESTSQGIRQEHRISLELYSLVIDHLEKQELVVRRDENNTPDPYIAIPSAVYYNYLYTRVNKYCLGLEFTLWSADVTRIDQDRSKAAIIFLRALKHSYSTTPMKMESTLWKDEWERKTWVLDDNHHRVPNQVENVTCKGLGMESIMMKTGCAQFCAGRFDWTTFLLLENVQEAVLQEHSRIIHHYKKRKINVFRIDDMNKIMDAGKEMLNTMQMEGASLSILIESLLHVVHLEFRRFVWERLVQSKYIRHDQVDLVQSGSYALSYRNLVAALQPAVGEPNIVRPYAGRFVYTDPFDYLSFVFEPGAEWTNSKGERRKRPEAWKKIAWRNRYEQVFNLIHHHARAHVKWYKDMFFFMVLMQNPLLPYSDTQDLISRTKGMVIEDRGYYSMVVPSVEEQEVWTNASQMTKTRQSWVCTAFKFALDNPAGINFERVGRQEVYDHLLMQDPHSFKTQASAYKAWKKLEEQNNAEMVFVGPDNIGETYQMADLSMYLYSVSGRKLRDELKDPEYYKKFQSVAQGE